MADCQICLEYREETGNPQDICGYCQCDARNRAGTDPYAFVRIERLAAQLKLPELDEIAEIVKIAEKVTRDECGYTREDLTDTIKQFRTPPIERNVTLRKEEWDFISDVLKESSWKGKVIRSRVRDQTR